MGIDLSFLSHVLFSDEDNFANTGNVKRHNMHYWANANCWCGIVSDHVIDPVAWPPRLPDVTSPDYFLWGFVKECVMAVAPTTPDDMKERIRRACTEITPQMLAEVRGSSKSEN